MMHLNIYGTKLIQNQYSKQSVIQYFLLRTPQGSPLLISHILNFPEFSRRLLYNLNTTLLKSEDCLDLRQLYGIYSMNVSVSIDSEYGP
jgi:hypothetical protein